VAQAGKSNLDNPFITNVFHRSPVDTIINGQVKTMYVYTTKPYTPLLADENMQFNILVPAVPLPDHVLARENARVEREFLASEAARYLQYEAEKEEALKTWRMNFLRDYAALPEDEDFEYPDFQEGQVVLLTNAPTTVDEVVIDSNGQASYVSRPNLISRSVALRNMTAEQKGQPEPKAYLDKIEAHNKIVNKCSARHDSDTVKAINIIELSLSSQVRTAVSNNLKIKHGKTLENIKAAGKDPKFSY